MFGIGYVIDAYNWHERDKARKEAIILYFANAVNLIPQGKYLMQGLDTVLDRIDNWEAQTAPQETPEEAVQRFCKGAGVTITHADQSI